MAGIPALKVYNIKLMFGGTKEIRTCKPNVISEEIASHEVLRLNQTAKDNGINIKYEKFLVGTNENEIKKTFDSIA